MKLIRLFIILAAIVISIPAGAQCKQRFVYDCALQNQGLIFLKEFNTKFSSGKIQRHKVFLNKGFMYTLQLCNPSDALYQEGNTLKSTGLAVNSMLSLYDNNNNILATTNQEFKFTFYCPKTDVYWVHIMPLSPKTSCAVGILSVKKR